MSSEAERSIAVLHALDKIGAINLDVLLGKADEVQSVLHSSGLRLEPGDICYKFSMHVGPRLVDIVEVAAEVERLGFQVSRAGIGERAL